MVPIKDLMTFPVISVDSQATVEAAAKLMCEKKVSSLLVKEGEEFVGIATKSDFVERLIAEGRDPKTTKIHSVMSKKPVFIDKRFFGHLKFLLSETI